MMETHNRMIFFIEMCIRDRPLSEPVPDREAEQPSGTDRESSTGENGQPDGEITGEESGTGQGSRSDGMDSTHERTDGNSGREHLDGIGIQLVEDTREDGLSKAEEEIASALSLPEYPTANEQRRQIEERAAALYAGEIPIPEEVVDEILRTGGNRKASQLRIIYNFMSEQTPEEYTEFVKREYLSLIHISSSREILCTVFPISIRILSLR